MGRGGVEGWRREGRRGHEGNGNDRTTWLVLVERLTRLLLDGEVIESKRGYRKKNISYYLITD